MVMCSGEDAPDFIDRQQVGRASNTIYSLFCVRMSRGYSTSSGKEKPIFQPRRDAIAEYPSGNVNSPPVWRVLGKSAG